MPLEAKKAIEAARLAEQGMLTILSAVIMSLWHYVWSVADAHHEHITIESGWIPRKCPSCKRMAISQARAS